MNLTTDQLKAVQSKAKLLFVNAGPGSGKTRVIIERIKHLVATGVEPGKILALTFTNKAANVMQERLKTAKIKGVTASTMHSLAVKLMLRRGDEFSIYDDDDCKAIIKRQMKAHKVDKDKIYDVIEEISTLKDNQITATTCSSIYRTIFLEYENELATNNACDFADLINNLIRIVSGDNMSHYDHLLVDEVQDLSNAQILVVRGMYDKLLPKEGCTITLVGDIDQSVYEWRNAKPLVIKNFVETSATTIGLGINFRSTKSIVFHSRKLIAFNKNRIDKILQSNSKENGSTPKIESFSDSNSEAEYIARLCNDRRNRSICVLYRSNWMSAQLELILTKQGTKYTVSDTVQFLDRKEIKDVLSYIRVAVNGNDHESLVRSIQTPKRGVGKKVLDKIKKFDDIIDNEKLQDYVSLIYNLRERKDDASSAIQGLLIRSKYLGHDEPDRLRNMESLSRLLAGKTLAEAMFEITGGSPTGTEDGDSDRVVSLMTLHSSKGTEYEKVIIMGCEEGITPHVNSYNIEEERRLFYVGMTRPEKELILTYTRKRLMYGTYVYQQPSRFIKEAGLSY